MFIKAFGCFLNPASVPARPCVCQSHKKQKIPDSKIFTSKTFRIKCVNRDFNDFATNARACVCVCVCVTHTHTCLLKPLAVF